MREVKLRGVFGSSGPTVNPRWVAVIGVGFLALISTVALVEGALLGEALGYVAQRPHEVLAAFGAYTLAFCVRAAGWRLLVVGRGEAPGFGRLLVWILVALFVNHVAPAKAGDLARMYGLARDGVSLERAVASVLLARIADLAGLLALTALCLLLARQSFTSFAGEPRALLEAVALPALVIVAVLLGVVLVMLLRGRRGLAPGETGRGVSPGPLRRLREFCGRALRAVGKVGPVRFGAALGLAVLAWVFEAGMLVFALRSVGIEISEVGLAGVMAATGVAVLATLVPLSPGGVGTYEAGMVLALVALGVPVEAALTAAILSHALKYLYALVCAPFAGLVVYEESVARASRAKNGKALSLDKTDETDETDRADRTRNQTEKGGTGVDEVRVRV